MAGVPRDDAPPKVLPAEADGRSCCVRGCTVLLKPLSGVGIGALPVYSRWEPSNDSTVPFGSHRWCVAVTALNPKGPIMPEPLIAHHAAHLRLGKDLSSTRSGSEAELQKTVNPPTGVGDRFANQGMSNETQSSKPILHYLLQL